MKIGIPVVVRPVRLGDYAPEYGDQMVYMWVNPPRRLRLESIALAERFEAAREEYGDVGDLETLPEAVEVMRDQLYAWWAEMWSQHDDAETHWTAEEVREVAEAAMESDPGLWEYLTNESMDTMLAYRERRQKNSSGRLSC